MAADIAGYSRLIGQDEEGTLRALRAHKQELIDQSIGEHGGRNLAASARRHTTHRASPAQRLGLREDRRDNVRPLFLQSVLPKHGGELVLRVVLFGNLRQLGEQQLRLARQRDPSGPIAHQLDVAEQPER